MECIQWWGPIYASGYGYLSRKKRRVRAHRFVWEECFGPLRHGMVLHHKCRNKSCVNPFHLEPLTRADHNRIHGSDVTKCPRGHLYTEENTYRRSGKWRSRKCRACNRERERERKYVKAA